MSFRQAFKMAVKSIVGKKMRSFLTMLGIIIGVAAVVIMVSVIQGQNQQWMKYGHEPGHKPPVCRGLFWEWNKHL